MTPADPPPPPIMEFSIIFLNCFLTLPLLLLSFDLKTFVRKFALFYNVLQIKTLKMTI